MRHAFYVFSVTCLFLVFVFQDVLLADLDNNRVIDHALARRIEILREENGYSSEDFNACQITWSVRKLDEADSPPLFQPHEITLYYEKREIIKLVNGHDGEAQSIRGLGLNCLEFNNYVYLFFDTLDEGTRRKFNLPELSYVMYSSDHGSTWSGLKSLDPFSTKAEFILPRGKFRKYVKIFGNARTHALAVFNPRDETTYLFDPEFNILKTVPVYNRLSDFENPRDFYAYENILYLVRGSCEEVKGRFRCPPRTYMETSEDFGRNWKKEVLPLMKKSYFFTVNNELYQIYFTPYPVTWLGLIPALNQSHLRGYVQVRKLDAAGRWGKPKILFKTASQLLEVFQDANPVLVWQDVRFHRSRPCGYIPLVGCVDANPFRGPTVIYAGTLDIANWRVDESIISYQN